MLLKRFLFPTLNYFLDLFSRVSLRSSKAILSRTLYF